MNYQKPQSTRDPSQDRGNYRCVPEERDSPDGHEHPGGPGTDTDESPGKEAVLG